MKRTTTELYGYVPKEMLDKRAFLAKFFKARAKIRVAELQKVKFEDRDDALINDCLKAQKHWQRFLDEEIK